MRSTFKNGFYGGVLVAFIIGLWLARLWQPENQVRLHSEHFIRQIEKRNWSATGNFVALDYRDDWGNDRSLLLTRLRMALRFFTSLTLSASDVQTRMESCAILEGGAPATPHPEGSPELAPPGSAHGKTCLAWSARILLAGRGGEAVPEITTRVNSLTTPFELRWRRESRWPWDWQLVRVSNPALQISGDNY